MSDLEEEDRLAQLVFGRAAGQMPRRVFLERNPNIDYHLYDQGKLVAYITIFPLKHETIMRFMNGEIRGWQIPPDDLEPLVPGKPLECLMMDMVTTPLAPPLERSTYGRRLLVNLLRTLQEWGEQGIEITKLYSVGNTPEGQSILRRARFKELGRVGSGRVSFELDIAQSDARLFAGYKAALAHWQQHQEQSATNDA